VTRERFIIHLDPRDVGDHVCDSAVSDDERRRHHRYRVGVFAEVAREGLPTIPSVTVDMSRSGASLLTAAPIERGALILLSFISVEDERQSAVGRVVYEAPTARSAMWCSKIGVEFSGRVPAFFDQEVAGRRHLGLVS
jgi:hypothetical protein